MKKHNVELASKRRFSKAFWVLFLVLLVPFFQNCGAGFQVSEPNSGSLIGLSVTDVIPDLPPPETPSNPQPLQKGLTISTPASPLVVGAAVNVSGNYTLNPSSIRLVWMSGTAEIGEPVVLTNFTGGTYSGTIAALNSPGVYKIKASYEGGAPTALTADITLTSASNRKLADFTFEGTGGPEPLVSLYGHAFAKGTLQPNDPVVLKRSDNGQLLRTQMNVLSRWSGGSVKTALFASEIPALASKAILSAELLAGQAHPSPGANLEMISQLSRRTAKVVVTPASGPAWEFDVAAAAISADRWHQGPLAISTRLETSVPESVTGGKGSVRLIVDLILTKDGILEMDVALSNDRVLHATGGIANFAYSIQIDGETLYSQTQNSLLQYSQWIRRRAKAETGPTFERPFFRPDFDLLVKSGVQLNYDRSQAIDANAIKQAVTDTLSVGLAKVTDPYWNWGLDRNAGAPGGRPEIGYRTFASALWLRDGSSEAIALSHRQFEAASTRPLYYYDWEMKRWLNPIDWPKMTVTQYQTSAPGTSRSVAVGLPANQRPTHNNRDHITVDHAHHGSFNWTVALLSGRRLAYDGLAARSAWAVMDIQDRANSKLLAGNTPNWRTLTPNHTTGDAWATRPWGPQTRSWAWDFRDIVDCAAILPDNYEQRSFYNQNVEAWVNSYYSVMPEMFTLFGDLGVPALHTNKDHFAGFMYSFLFYGAAVAKQLNLGGPNLDAVLDGWIKVRMGSILDEGINYRLALSGRDMYFRGGADPAAAKTWAEVYAKTVAAVGDTPADWSTGQGDGDWNRNVLSGLGLLMALDLPIKTQAKVAEGLVLLRSERNPTGTDFPRIAPNGYFAGNFSTNSLTAPGLTWQWNSAPVIRSGQSFTIDRSAMAGDIVGVVKTEGPIPRNSASGRGVDDACQITSQPAGNPFRISGGGVIRRASVGLLTPGVTTLQVKCSTWEGNSSTRHESAAEAVTVTVFDN